jgi:hypothetical protein
MGRIKEAVKVWVSPSASFNGKRGEKKVSWQLMMLKAAGSR